MFPKNVQLIGTSEKDNIMNKIKSEQSGRSMVEMLGVLAIIGVLSVGGIAGYSKAMAKFKLSKAMDQISTIVANIRTLYSSQPSYSDLTTQVAIMAGAIPTEMLNGESTTTATKAYNAYNGPAYVDFVGSIGMDGATEGVFGIGFGGLGKEACVALSTADWGYESNSGFIMASVTTGNFNGISKSIPRGQNVGPLSLSQAATNCKGVGDTNNVTWYFK